MSQGRAGELKLLNPLRIIAVMVKSTTVRNLPGDLS
jgi:hypothetical protein